MKTYSGQARVKEDSTYVHYRGLVFNITGVYIEYKNGSGVGVYADGTRDYKLDFSMHPALVKKQGYSTTVIHDKNLEIIELNETMILPLDEKETLELIAFSRAYVNQYKSDKELLAEFIEANTQPSVLPTPDLSTIYSDKEWDKKQQ